MKDFIKHKKSALCWVLAVCLSLSVSAFAVPASADTDEQSSSDLSVISSTQSDSSSLDVDSLQQSIETADTEETIISDVDIDDDFSDDCVLVTMKQNASVIQTTGLLRLKVKAVMRFMAALKMDCRVGALCQISILDWQQDNLNLYFKNGLIIFSDGKTDCRCVVNKPSVSKATYKILPPDIKHY